MKSRFSDKRAPPRDTRQPCSACPSDRAYYGWGGRMYCAACRPDEALGAWRRAQA